MCLFYDSVLEMEEPIQDQNKVEALVNSELLKAKKALVSFHKVESDSIQLRESIANKTFNDLQGTHQLYHVVKNEMVVEILELFYTYNGTFINVFSHNPSISKSIKED